ICYMSARDAVLPRLVPKEALPTANAVSMASAYGAMPVGSGLFALVTWAQARAGHTGVGLPLFLAAVIVGFATLLVGRVDATACKREQRSNDVGATHEHASFREGIRALRVLLKADPVLK